LGSKDVEQGDHERFAQPPFAPPSSPGSTDYRHARWPRFSDPSPAENESLLRQPQKLTPTPRARRKSPDVLVVGVCSSGKSTLVRKLKDAGYSAGACAQEHSYIPHLWQLSEPRSLVYLDASLDTIRTRRRANWQPAMLEEQHRRLAHARDHADLYIQTDTLTAEEVSEQAIRFLGSRSA